MDLAKAAPTVPDCQAAAAAAAPARPAAYDTTLDHAPFETMEKYYPCPQAGISRSLMTGDVNGAQVCTTIRDPLDPMVKIKILDGLPPSFPPTETYQHPKFSIPSGKTKTNSEPIFFFSITIVGNPKNKTKKIEIKHISITQPGKLRLDQKRK